MSNYKEYNNEPVIKKYSLAENLDQITAQQHFSALKDFLKFASTSSKPCFPSGDIDKIWHTFILFTKDYQSYCMSNFGNLIHHIPFVDDSDKISLFKPGYFFYLDNQQLKRKFVRSLKGLNRVAKNSADCKSSCGSGGDCTSGCNSGPDK